MPSKMAEKLRSWQVEPVTRLLDILSKHNSAIDMSETGTGKTFVACAVAATLRVPTLVVCPKIVMTAWHRAAAHFNDSVRVINYERLRTGNTEYGQWENQCILNVRRQNYFVCHCCQQRVDIENSQQCYAHPLGIHCIEKKSAPFKRGAFNFPAEVKFLVFDEIHRCGAIDSLNAELLIAAKRQGIKTLGLSATPACSPLQMRALGYLLDLHNDKTYKFIGPPRCAKGQCRRDMLPEFYRWLAKYGCRKLPPLPGLHWAVSAERQQQIMAEIRSQIIPARGVRVTTDSIPDFPERQIDFVEYDIDNPEKIDELYAAMAEPLAELKLKTQQDREHPLTKILRVRQQIELLKVPIFAELAEDFLAKNFSVALFLNFRASLQQLENRFGCDAIHGDNLPGERDAAIDRFKNDKTRIILIQSAAGSEGLSLHDERGEFSRVGIVSPSWSVRELIQVCGRLHRTGGKSKCYYRVVFAARTVESRIIRALELKNNCLSALTDGDLMPHC